MKLDKTVILLAGFGFILILLSIPLSLSSESSLPTILSVVLAAFLVFIKPAVNQLLSGGPAAQAEKVVQTLQGKERIDEIKKIIESSEGNRELFDGAETYIKVLCYLLNRVGVEGLDLYHPPNMKTFHPLGLFMMEITASPKWHRCRSYAVLSLAGEDPGTLSDNFEARDWDDAVQKLITEANFGIRTAKHLEVRSPVLQKAFEHSLTQI